MAQHTTGFPAPSVCPKCKSVNPFRTGLCYKCGTPMTADSPPCPQCGEQRNLPDSKTCIKCGQELKK